MDFYEAIRNQIYKEIFLHMGKKAKYLVWRAS